MFAKLAIAIGVVLLAASISIPLAKTNDVQRELKELSPKKDPLRRDLEAKEAAFKPIGRDADRLRRQIKRNPDLMDDTAFAEKANALFASETDLGDAYYKVVGDDAALRGRLKSAQYESEHDVPTYRRRGIFGAVAGALLACLGLGLWYASGNPKRRADMSASSATV